MDNALEADDGEETRGDGSSGDGAKDDQAEETSGVASALSLEEEFTARRGTGSILSHDG